MSSVVPSTVAASVEVTYSNPGLFVGVQIFDDSGSTPSPVTGLSGMVGDVLPLLNWSGNAYRFKHLGAAGKWYLYLIAAYTDDTYATVDTDQPQGSDSLYFEAPESGGMAGIFTTIEGFIDPITEIT